MLESFFSRFAYRKPETLSERNCGRQREFYRFLNIPENFTDFLRAYIL